MATAGKLTNLIDTSQFGRMERAYIDLVKGVSAIKKDAFYKQCNSGTIEETSVITSHPVATVMEFNKGVEATKESRNTIKDNTMMLQIRGQVDVNLVNKEPESERAAFRAGQSQAKMAALEMDVERKIFYGNSDVDPRDIKGFAARLNDISLDQVIDGGGTGTDNTSIYIVTWGLDAARIIYPEGLGSIGIKHEYKGEENVQDDNGLTFYAHVDLFSQAFGVSVADYRKITRVANIDVSSISSVDLYDLLHDALYANEGYDSNGEGENAMMAIYVNRNTGKHLAKQLASKGLTVGAPNYVNIGADDVIKKMPMQIDGIPVRMTSAILNTEARVV